HKAPTRAVASTNRGHSRVGRCVGVMDMVAGRQLGGCRGNEMPLPTSDTVGEAERLILKGKQIRCQAPARQCAARVGKLQGISWVYCFFGLFGGGPLML